MEAGVLGHENLETTKVCSRPDLSTVSDLMSEVLMGQLEQKPEWQDNEDFIRLALALTLQEIAKQIWLYNTKFGG